MENEETAANPADEGIVTLPNPGETSEPSTEAASPDAGDESDDLDALAKEALGETSDDAKPEFIEVEIDGKTYKVLSADGEPVDPELKFGALRDADYRKKTMTLSEERKIVQQERAIINARANLQGEAAAREKQLSALDAEIRQIASIPISQLQQEGWTDEDIGEAQEHLRQKQAQRQQLVGQVSQDIQRLQAFEQASILKARQDAIQQAQLSDKALTPERISYLEEFAVKSGKTLEDVRSITDPADYKLLHLADVGQKFLERQSKAATMKAAATGSPAKTLGGVKAGSKSPDQMSPGEMAKLLGY